MNFLRIVLLVALVAVLGCGEEVQSVTPPTAAPAAQGVKAMLLEIAETGELGSGAMELRENLQKVEGADALLPELDSLESLTDPAQIKAKAKAMADKL
jgi:hypothetical protein